MRDVIYLIRLDSLFVPAEGEHNFNRSNVERPEIVAAVSSHVAEQENREIGFTPSPTAQLRFLKCFA